MEPLERLLAGYDRFRKSYFENETPVYERLCREGQRPHSLIIACCDSRVDPAILFDAKPGELFVVRNVANLVPPCAVDIHNHGTSAALEFAVNYLEVRQIVVLGHSCCGGIRALIEGLPKDRPHQFISNWMSIAAAVREAVFDEMPDVSAETRARIAELRSIVASLENLMTFPWVRTRFKDERLAVHGFYFDMGRGELLRYDPERGRFVMPPVNSYPPRIGDGDEPRNDRK